MLKESKLVFFCSASYLKELLIGEVPVKVLFSETHYAENKGGRLSYPKINKHLRIKTLKK